MNCVRLPLISLLTILLACLPIVSAAQTAPVDDLQAIIDRAEAGGLPAHDRGRVLPRADPADLEAEPVGMSGLIATAERLP